MPEVINNPSCKKDVIDIDSVRWNHYPMNLGDYPNIGLVEMSQDKLCGVKARTNETTKSINKMKGSLDNMVQTMSDAITGGTLYYANEGFSLGSDSFGDSVNLLASINSNGSQSITPEYVNVSNINVIQKNTMFTIWCVLTFVMFIVAMVLLSKSGKE
jgi:hypothetical protein